MEAGTAPAATTSTGSKTIADMAALAAEQHAERTAIRVKRDGEWTDVSFVELGAIVSELARGLIDLGIAAGDRVSILANTRPEWTYADFAISSVGAVVVPIYPTNSPEECEWVIGNSGARAIVCEDASQLEKVLQVRDRLPALEHLVVIDGGPRTEMAISVADLRERGRAVHEERLQERREGVSGDDPFTFIYTSGTTGPPKGCVLTHGNYRSVLDMCEGIGTIADDEVTYLYLPLAHSFALLIQLLSIDVGGTIAYFGGDTKQIIPELAEVHPTYLPSVPRVFEKLYTLVTANADPAQLEEAVKVGLAVRELELAGPGTADEVRGRIPDELRAGFDKADAALFSKVRAAFGGRVRQAVTGAAPIAPEILEFFYACGVPVLEGYGMTETATVATYSTIENFRFGTVGRALPGCEVKIAGDGEVLIKGANIFSGYYKDAEKSFGSIEDGWLHTGDLGSLDADGYLKISGRKKDIIITAGGKNITPANLENELKQSRWVSQAVMYGDRRPYPVALITLDEEEIVPWAEGQKGLPSTVAELAEDPRVRALIQAELDKVNARYAQVEKIKRFAILDHDLSQPTGELTPTLKVKRNVVSEKYADVFEALYRT